MEEQPTYPWSLYAELQSGDLQVTHLTDATWGNEAGMNHFLSVLESGSTPADVSDFRRSLQTAMATGAWNERNRARLRRKYLQVSESENRREERQILARLRLQEVQAVLKPVDWEVLLDVANGFSYDELAASRGISSGGIRTRVSRLRSRLLQ